MSKLVKDVKAHGQRPDATKPGDAPRDATRNKAEARAWASVNKLPGGGNKTDSRRKVPSGPLGGSGHKTNLSRSS